MIPYTKRASNPGGTFVHLRTHDTGSVCWTGYNIRCAGRDGFSVLDGIQLLVCWTGRDTTCGVLKAVRRFLQKLCGDISNQMSGRTLGCSPVLCDYLCALWDRLLPLSGKLGNYRLLAIQCCRSTRQTTVRSSFPCFLPVLPHPATCHFCSWQHVMLITGVLQHAVTSPMIPCGSSIPTENGPCSPKSEASRITQEALFVFRVSWMNEQTNQGTNEHPLNSGRMNENTDHRTNQVTNQRSNR